MKHEDSRIVTSDAVRPARPDGTCFHCLRAVGELHTDDCVHVRQSVVVEARIRALVLVPASWNSHDIEFYLNESSYCATNLVNDIGRVSDLREAADLCMCPFFSATFVREATAEDEQELAEFLKAAAPDQGDTPPWRSLESDPPPVGARIVVYRHDLGHHSDVGTFDGDDIHIGWNGRVTPRSAWTWWMPLPANKE